MNGEDAVHPRQAKHFGHRWGQAGQFQWPRRPEQFHHRDNGAKAAAVKEGDLRQIENDRRSGFFGRKTNRFLEIDGNGSVNAAVIDRDDQSRARP